MSDTTEAIQTTEESTRAHQGDGAAQAVAAPGAQTPARFDAYAIEEVKRQVGLVQEVMNDVMQKDTHYGTIPGTGKPTLLKAGAEKLNLTFRLSPQYEVEREDFEASEDRPLGHREYTVHCRLYHIASGDLWGEGVGSCSTLESKYRYRTAKLTCPQCGEETVIKGKKEYGGGWLCWKKKGGCGAKWDDGAEAIEGQERGKVENPDIADVYNTCLKMAKKRAHVDAVLTCTAASDIFTQDVEDFAGENAPAPAPTPKRRQESREPEQASVKGNPRQQGPPPRPRPQRGQQNASKQSGQKRKKGAGYDDHLEEIEKRLHNAKDRPTFEEGASRYENWVEEQDWPKGKKRRLTQIIKKERARRGQGGGAEAADDILDGNTALNKGGD